MCEKIKTLHKEKVNDLFRLATVFKTFFGINTKNDFIETFVFNKCKCILDIPLLREI